MAATQQEIDDFVQQHTYWFKLRLFLLQYWHGRDALLEMDRSLRRSR
jgi:hypothetical protein